jgi:hypothetical protein
MKILCVTIPLFWEIISGRLKFRLRLRFSCGFFSNKILLTKDNLAKYHWNGCTKYVFCGEQETIQHLFIECPLAKLLWRTVNFTYDLPPPTNITNMFGNWLNGVDRQSKSFIRIEVSALCWSIWRVRNDIIFNKKVSFHFL